MSHHRSRHRIFLAFGRGMQQAATERGVDYVTATSGNDTAKHVDQMNAFLEQGVGSLTMQPLNPDADSLVLQRAIDKGVCTQGIITAPSTMQVVASQYGLNVSIDARDEEPHWRRFERRLGSFGRVIRFDPADLGCRTRSCSAPRWRSSTGRRTLWRSSMRSDRSVRRCTSPLACRLSPTRAKCSCPEW